MLSTVNRNKVHASGAALKEAVMSRPQQPQGAWVHPNYFVSFPRIHPDHYDDGGVGAARRHDGYPRGELSGCSLTIIDL